MPSKLEQLQLQFRQRLKEERMIKIHTDNQQKALSKVSKYNGVHGTAHPAVAAPKPQPAIVPSQPHHSPIKKGSPGVDRSRPLPPISKEPRNTSSSRSSPTGGLVENGVKVPTTVNSRSRSVDLEQRNAPSRPVQNGSRMPPKNGYSKPPNPEPKPMCQAEISSERKADQDTLSKLKQAELQRLKANSKAREDTSTRNGYNGTITKSSIEQKKPVKPSNPTVAPSRPKPRIQAAASSLTFKRPAATSTKPVSRNAQNANANGAPRKPPGPGQEQCNICGRNFNQDRIDKHTTICKKAAQKKVKVFDATKMRVKGTEAEQFVKKGLPKAEPKQSKKSDWRKKHNEFIEAIRQAKMVQQHLAKGGKVSDLPPPPPSDTSDYVPCPHCGRKFNEGVAERHIPKCKNIVCNKKNPAPNRRK